MAVTKCLIVDDEPLACDLIEMHLKKFDDFELVAKCESAMAAISVLKENDVDLIFLDIEMPEISGLDFIKSTPTRPLIVLTTAYSEYAVEAFELDVFDYLLKPISFSRFFKTIQKIQAKTSQTSEQSANEGHESEAKCIYVKSDGKVVKVHLEDILFVEAMQKYVKIHLSDKRIISLMSLKKMEEMLPLASFQRVHKSYIINTIHLDELNGYEVKIGKHSIPVSRSHKKALARRLK